MAAMSTVLIRREPTSAVVIRLRQPSSFLLCHVVPHNRFGPCADVDRHPRSHWRCPMSELRPPWRPHRRPGLRRLGNSFLLRLLCGRSPSSAPTAPSASRPLSAALNCQPPRHAVLAGVTRGLDLSEVASNAIWTVLRRGLSSGEKRRVSVGAVPATWPAVLCLNKATSGPDAAV